MERVLRPWLLIVGMAVLVVINLAVMAYRTRSVLAEQT